MKKLKYKDGDVVHGLRVVKFYSEQDRRKCLFVCPVCSTEHSVLRGNLLGGKVKSCGCNQNHKREYKPHTYTDLSGQIFGDLHVIKRDFTRRDRVQFLCRCKCGKVVSIFSHYLTAGKNRTCGCSRHFIGDKSNSWKGCGDITGHYFAHIRGQAKIRNLEFGVSVEDVWSLFLAQDRRCRLTGLPLDLFPDKHRIRTASLDRIDNSKGYVEGNLQWVHKDVNYMKRTLTQEQLVTYCHLISKNYPMST